MCCSRRRVEARAEDIGRPGFGWRAVADRELRPKLKVLVARIKVYPELRLVCSSRQRVEARVEDVGRPD